MYPALSVLQALGNEAQNTTLWVGGQSELEKELVARQGVPYTGIPAAGLHGVGLRSLPRNLGQLAQGFLASQRILKQFNPDVLVFTGGYVAFPMALAGRGRPILLYVPDIEPGLALKSLARFADVIALTNGDSTRFFNAHKRLVITGYPTRPELSGWDRSTARTRLGLSSDLPVLLVFGGSKGARSINRALLAALPRLLPSMQIVHISGNLDWPEVQAVYSELAPQLAPRYHSFPYLHEMGAALASADLAVSRAGASILGEYPLFGLPAVLVPYPYAWRYQHVNADYLQKHGAAEIVEDTELNHLLSNRVETLIHHTEKLAGMRKSMQSLCKPEAAAQLAHLVQELSSQGKTRG